MSRSALMLAIVMLADETVSPSRRATPALFVVALRGEPRTENVTSSPSIASPTSSTNRT